MTYSDCCKLLLTSPDGQANGVSLTADLREGVPLLEPEPEVLNEVRYLLDGSGEGAQLFTNGFATVLMPAQSPAGGTEESVVKIQTSEVADGSLSLTVALPEVDVVNDLPMDLSVFSVLLLSLAAAKGQVAGLLEVAVGRPYLLSVDRPKASLEVDAPRSLVPATVLLRLL